MQSWLTQLFGPKARGDHQRHPAIHNKHRRHGAAALEGLPALAATQTDLLPVEEGSGATFDAALKPLARHSGQELGSASASQRRPAAPLEYRHGDWQVELPLRVRVRGTVAGGPDLQLQLLDVRWGTAKDCVPREPGSGDRRSMSEAAVELGSRVAALAFASVLFPDAVSPVTARMAVAGMVSAAAGLAVEALARTAPADSRQRTAPRDRQPSSEDDVAWRLVERASWINDSCLSAAVLGFAVILARAAAPDKFHLLRCIAALLPLSAGYKQTERQNARGRFLTAAEAEAAWRARHKWAAQRVAQLLTDLPPRPPLAAASAFIDLSCLRVALPIGGDAGDTGPCEGRLQLWASFPVPQRRLAEQDDPNQSWPDELVAAPAAPAGTARPKAVPAGPSRGAFDVDVDARGSANGALTTDDALALAPVKADSIAAHAAGSVTRVNGSDALVVSAQPSSKAPQPHARVDGADARPSTAPDATPAPSRRRVSDPGASSSAQPPPSLAGPEDDSLRAAGSAAARPPVGLPSPDPGQPYPTSHLPTVRTREELLAAMENKWEEHPSNLPETTSEYTVSGASTPGLEPAEQPVQALAGGGPRGDADGGVLARAASLARDAASAPQPAGPRATVTAAAQAAAERRVSFVDDAEALSTVEDIRPFMDTSTEPLAPLYGRADHAPRGPVHLSATERFALTLRALYLLLVFAPFMTVGVFLLLLAHYALSGAASARLRNAAYRLLLFACRASGAAFIKWGQWASSRPDMLPEDLCRVLSALQQDAPAHSFAQTRRQVEAAFRRPLADVFEVFDEKPVASASIAQVHKAVLREGGRSRPVAVKVRHPGVARRIKQDFQLLIPLARATSRFKALKGLSLEQSVSQFSHTMTAQADLRVEAAHLRRFLHNFAPLRESITAPEPVAPWVTEAVLVESFEPGATVDRYIQAPASFNSKIVGLGVDAYLKMLLIDNFVHTDLHPGNIFVRARAEPQAGPAARPEARPGAAADGQAAPSVDPLDAARQLQLVLLDFGLAEELSPPVRHHFISFLHCIASGDGLRAAEHMLQMGNNDACPDRAGFILDMTELFARECNICAPAGIDVDTVLKSVLLLARKHEVAIDSGYAALVLGVCVIVGFATGLDPCVNLMDAATPCFFVSQLTGRVRGSLYS